MSLGRRPRALIDGPVTNRTAKVYTGTRHPRNLPMSEYRVPFLWLSFSRSLSQVHTVDVPCLQCQRKSDLNRAFDAGRGVGRM